MLSMEYYLIWRYIEINFVPRSLPKLVISWVSQVVELQNPALIGACYTVATPGFQLFDMLHVCAF